MNIREEKHDLVLEELIKRLAKHPGFLSIKQKYYTEHKEGFVLHGEYDVMKITKNSRGKRFFTYYEVKGRDSPIAYERALEQFKRHKHYHPDQDWKYVYVTDEKVKRVRL